MVLNPNIQQNEENILVEQIPDEVWLRALRISKETPQQYRERKNHEKYEKQKKECEKYYTSEERNKLNPEFPKKYKKNPTELEKHRQRMKREEYKEKKRIALDEEIARDRQRQRAIETDLANAYYGNINIGGRYRFNSGSSRHMSWNVEGN
jgi:hypothetical protein